MSIQIRENWNRMCWLFSVAAIWDLGVAILDFSIGYYLLGFALLIASLIMVYCLWFELKNDPLQMLVEI